MRAAEDRETASGELDSDEDAQASGSSLCGLGRMQLFDRFFNRDKQQQQQRESSPASSVCPAGSTSGGELRSGLANLALLKIVHFTSISVTFL